MSSRKPLGQNWYDVPVNAPDFIISYTLTYGKYISILIYAYDGEVFARLESKKEKIENVFGDNLDWYSSIATKRNCQHRNYLHINQNGRENSLPLVLLKL